MDKEYTEIFLDGKGMTCKANFTTNKHMTKDRIQRPKLKKIDILDSFKYSRDHAKPLQRVA